MVEARVCELRRAHPRWGALRIVHELMRGPAVLEPLPSRATVHRILVRHGLVVPRAAAQALGVSALAAAGGDAALAARHRLWAAAGRRPSPGELREARIVTGVDDHSRFCVLARVSSARPAARSAWRSRRRSSAMGRRRRCSAITASSSPIGSVAAGEVLFDKICRRNGIAHRLTQPSSPTTTGKIERFHQTLRRELLDDAPPFSSAAGGAGCAG
jgi:transposase InsO family protein